ncbi:DUF6541 family protein [Aeromicrobium phragmitis]|uniref:DUF6541 family protein n=1 Tax=Aeromicrobium phragmitis TaxID=2478914 RepID=UPI0010621CDA|nr:DUF6541 family protein [Aeromicrobium phragmitis]
MLDWIALTPSVVVAAALLVIPGATLVAALGLRGFGVVAAGVPVSVTTISGAAIVAPWIGLDWGLLPVAIVWTGALLLAAGLGWVLRRNRDTASRRTPSPAAFWPSAGALVLGTLVMTYLIAQSVKSPENFSMRFDNAFHTSAIRWAVETGNASSLSISSFSSFDGASSLYPAAWHGFVALVADVTGVSVPAAINAANIAAAALGWVAGTIFLALVAIGRRRAVPWTAALVACGFQAFPLLLLNWGTLYPNFFGVTLLPALLALTVLVLRVRGTHREGSIVVALLVAIAALPGALLAHPNAVMAWGLAALAMVFVRLGEWVASRSSQRGQALLIALATGLVLIAAFAAVWNRLRPSLDVAPWKAYQGPVGAVREWLTVSPLGSSIPWVVTVFMLVGVGVLVWRRRFAFVAVWLVFGLLFIISTGAPDGALREYAVGVFYQDNPRLAALTAVGALVPTAVGAMTVGRGVVVLVRRYLPGRRLAAPVAVGIFALACVAVTFQQTIGQAMAWTTSAYVPTQRSQLIDTEELRMIDRLPDLVPEDALILGEPGGGTPFIYALTGIRTAPAYMFYEASDEELEIFHTIEHADRPENRERLCAAADELADASALYIADFNGSGYRNTQVAGLRRPDPRTTELVATEGSVQLYRVTVCDDL